MKAIRKSDGKEIDVVVFHELEYIETKENEDGSGRRLYTPDAIILEEPRDYNAIRAELASRNLQAILGNNAVNVDIGKMVREPEEGIMLQAKMAVMYADALIAALKEEPEWEF